MSHQPSKSNEEIVQDFKDVYLKSMRKHYGRKRFDGDLQLVRDEIIGWLYKILNPQPNSDKLWGEGYYAGILYERNRIEEIFKKHVPPHAMDLEDSVWLKRLLNKAFHHENLY